jgi:lipopolysaccharide transport system permease protein
MTGAGQRPPTIAPSPVPDEAPDVPLPAALLPQSNMAAIDDAEPWDQVIRPASGWVPLELRELWAYRELLYFLVWRNIKIRYKQTVLGAAWAIVQPLFTMLAFAIFFGRLAGIPTNGVPYPLFALAALVPWTFFANALTLASNSLLEHERMITKVYFPRLLLPLAAVLSGLLDFAIAFAVLFAMLLAYGRLPTIAALTVPLFILLATVAAFGVSLWLAAVNVQYRDVRYVIPFVVQFWLFVTPIAYPSSLVPPAWQAVYGLNPMVGVVEGFRWALLGQTDLNWGMLAVSVVTIAAVLLGGLFWFRRMEETFADVV